MQVWSRGLKDVETLTQAFPLPFLAGGFSGTWETEDMALLTNKTKQRSKIKFSLTVNVKLATL